MNREGVTLERTSAGFAVAAGVTVLFSTALAWAKDAFPPLTRVMNGLAWHNWITHGLAVVLLFCGLGLVFSRARAIDRIAPDRLIFGLVTAVVTASVGLFVWYAVF